MFKIFKNKKTRINLKPGEMKKGIIGSQIFLKSKEDLKKDEASLFDEILKLDHKKHEVFMRTHNNKFNQILMSRDYADYKYISLQLFLIQSNLENFTFTEIEKYVVEIIKFIEESLRSLKSISFEDKFYLQQFKSGKNKTKYFVQATNIKPLGPIYHLKNIQILLKGLRDYAIYKFVIDNFAKIVNFLLENSYRILIGNILILRNMNNIMSVVSEKFYQDTHDNRHDLTLTFDIVEPSHEKIVDKTQLKTQLLYVNKENKTKKETIKKLRKISSKNSINTSKTNKLEKSHDDKENNLDKAISHIDKTMGNMAKENVSSAKKDKSKNNIKN